MQMEQVSFFLFYVDRLSGKSIHEDLHRKQRIREHQIGLTKSPDKGTGCLEKLL